MLALRGGGGGSAPSGAKETLTAAATLSSRSILFGDPVEARLDVILPRGAEGGALRVQTDFRPFQIVSRHIARENLGAGLQRISLRFGLACLSLRCVSSGTVTHVQFGPTSVSIPGRRIRAAWPSLVQVSRVVDVRTPVSDDLDSGPAVSPGLAPRSDAYEALAAAAASLVLLLSSWLYLHRRARRRLAPVRRASVLQALLERVEAGLPEDVLYRQRHALDALAVELRHRHVNGSLAVDAERLAWAPEHPSPEEVRALCEQVRKAVEP